MLKLLQFLLRIFAPGILLTGSGKIWTGHNNWYNKIFATTSDQEM